MAGSPDGGLSIDPMKQFIIKPLGGGEMSMLAITNSTLWMVVAVVAISGLTIFGTAGRAVVPSRVQSVAEIFYSFIRDMVNDVLGEDGPKFFPYIFVLFIFILFSNLLGIIPASFTTTSHIAVTATLAMAVFLTVICIGFYKNGAGFLKLFWVDSAPLALRPILAVIELISFFVRPLSHSIRLAGNMMAGHAVMKVFAGFVPALGIAGILPLGMMVAITGLELLVACVQAYIFAILTCIYLNDALHPGH
ncbi:MAG: F0F1 ATP synthase subunit A [Pseudomonadota bacterium]